MRSKPGPLIGLGLLLGSTLGATPLLINRYIEPDLRRATIGWLNDAGAQNVTIDSIKGQDIVLRGPANEQNLAYEAVLRGRSSKHWVEGITYNAERNPAAEPPATSAAPTSTTATTPSTSAVPSTTTSEPSSTSAAAPLVSAAPAGSVASKSTCPASFPVLAGTAFGTGAAALTDAAKATLDQVAAAIIAAPGCNVTVGGHTDSRGDDFYNKALSLDRANAVRNYLIFKGIAADRLTAVGFGETKPKVTPEASNEDRAANRRIEFTPTNAGS
jgi:outer membrane protein OmpA-like peptidoglycan-associated protein